MSMSSPATGSNETATLGALAVQVSDLAQRVRRLEHEADAPPPAPVSKETIEQVHILTQRLFPGPISTRIGCDPENPVDSWIVFDVEAKGSYADFRDREFEWYEAIAKLNGDEQADFRLCILPNP